MAPGMLVPMEPPGPFIMSLGEETQACAHCPELTAVKHEDRVAAVEQVLHGAADSRRMEGAFARGLKVCPVRRYVGQG